MSLMGVVEWETMHKVLCFQVLLVNRALRGTADGVIGCDESRLLMGLVSDHTQDNAIRSESAGFYSAMVIDYLNIMPIPTPKGSFHYIDAADIRIKSTYILYPTPPAVTFPRLCHLAETISIYIQ
jgi:hypothetical protein